MSTAFVQTNKVFVASPQKAVASISPAASPVPHPVSLSPVSSPIVATAENAHTLISHPQQQPQQQKQQQQQPKSIPIDKDAVTRTVQQLGPQARKDLRGALAAFEHIIQALEPAAFSFLNELFSVVSNAVILQLQKDAVIEAAASQPVVEIEVIEASDDDDAVSPGCIARRKQKNVEKKAIKEKEKAAALVAEAEKATKKSREYELKAAEGKKRKRTDD